MNDELQQIIEELEPTDADTQQPASVLPNQETAETPQATEGPSITPSATPANVETADQTEDHIEGAETSDNMQTIENTVDSNTDANIDVDTNTDTGTDAPLPVTIVSPEIFDYTKEFQQLYTLVGDAKSDSLQLQKELLAVQKAQTSISVWLLFGLFLLLGIVLARVVFRKF